MTVEVIQRRAVGENNVALARIEILEAFRRTSGKTCYLAEALCKLRVGVERIHSLRRGAHRHVFAARRSLFQIVDPFLAATTMSLCTYGPYCVYLPLSISCWSSAMPPHAQSILPEVSSIYTFSFSIDCIFSVQPSLSHTAIASSTSKPQYSPFEI